MRHAARYLQTACSCILISVLIVNAASRNFEVSAGPGEDVTAVSSALFDALTDALNCKLPRDSRSLSCLKAHHALGIHAICQT